MLERVAPISDEVFPKFLSNEYFDCKQTFCWTSIKVGRLSRQIKMVDQVVEEVTYNYVRHVAKHFRHLF